MTEKRYSIIYADPPWRYKDTRGNRPAYGGITYPTMPLEEIKALPVSDLADKNCALFLWVTFPFLREGFEVIEAWGFKYTTCAFVWVKQNAANDYKHPMLFFPTDKEALNIKMGGVGNWTNSNCELCLLAKKGKPKRAATGVKQVILAPVQKHSRKPAEARERIVRLMGHVPRVELFARDKADGWDVWGNEVSSDVELKVA